MKKKLLLIGYHFYPEPTGIGKYSGEMINWLSKYGYDCTVLTTYPFYPHWQVQEPYCRNRFGFKTESEHFPSGGKLTIYRCPIYVPAQPSGWKRILLDFTFLLSAGLKLLSLLPGHKFDFVLTVAPSFLGGLLGVLYKKIWKSPHLYHIQDLQIEAARNLKMVKFAPLINAMFRLEKYIYDQSDIITSIDEGMMQKIAQKAKKEIVHFPNWTDTRAFYPMENKWELKQEFGFKETDQVILYSGAIGEKQGLEAILFAAKESREQKHLKFLICGCGPYKQKLQHQTETLQLDNVFFLPLQPHENFNRFLNLADVHLIIQKSHVSDLVMPSKLTTILAVGGLVIVTANPGCTLHNLVEFHQLGILVDSENQAALNEGIRKALSQDHSHLTRNARAFAESHLSIDRIMGDFENRVNAAMVPQPGMALAGIN